MPMLVRTPQEIMRETKRDLYLIEFLFPGKFYSFYKAASDSAESEPEDQETEQATHDNPPGRQEIIEWIESELPGTRWEPLAPSERSGIICGGIEGRICVHFDDAGLAKFCARWEHNDFSIDPRFQCVGLLYASCMKDDMGPPNYDEMDF